MKKKLVIVESPSKASTIKKYLGSGYNVVASMGHIIDLPKSQLGIDVENDFEPKFITIRGKGDLLKSLKKDAKNAKKIYLEEVGEDGSRYTDLENPRVLRSMIKRIKLKLHNKDVKDALDEWAETD